MIDEKVNIVWLRRSLRLNDNLLLEEASRYKLPVILIFILDDSKLCNPRVRSLIFFLLHQINVKLRKRNSEILVIYNNNKAAIEELMKKYKPVHLITNEEYEPQQIKEDIEIENILNKNNCNFIKIKDHVVFSPTEILKSDSTPYTVYTPYKNKWLQMFSDQKIKGMPDLMYVSITNKNKLVFDSNLFKPYTLENLSKYADERDYPANDSGSYIGSYLRYGGSSIRELANLAKNTSSVFLSELIWREFFMQILFHYPHSQTSSFKPGYDFIPWRNNGNEFERWKYGNTGIPIVDAGMRELKETGYMHNRVRMITASFLVKNLLIDWRWGEAWFAQNLLDYELSSNIGNWQWVAGSGCDAAPYFRVFNPITQQQKFDKDFVYIKKWVPELNTNTYPAPMVDLKNSRTRAIETYKNNIRK